MIFSTLVIDYNKAAFAAECKAGDISRRKKVKEKRPSPFLFRMALAGGPFRNGLPAREINDF
jgi:hypothetical protein